MNRAAIYARYSTDKQSEASVEDQNRVCERLAEREGFTVVARFEDRGISGGTTQRPGYQAMLDSARQRSFEVVICEDTSRLWREMSEQWRALKELHRLGVHVIGHGIDTRRDESKILLSVTGAMAEAYRDEISRRTRRGLEGRAANRAPTGGRAYGYVAAKDSGTRKVEVHPEQVAIVRRIFEEFAEGASPRTIAAGLNADGIPSPGSTWNRTDTGMNAKRRSLWVASAIHGHGQTGILNNCKYVGRITWGRTRWERDSADSSQRLVRAAREPVIEYTDERLRIVPDALWERVKSRQRQTFAASTKLRAALNKRPDGRPARHLLSGLMRCESCGGAYARVDAYRYGCSTHKNGGTSACANGLTIKAKDAERLLLDRIEGELLAPEAIEAAVTAYRDEMAKLRRTERKAAKAPANVQRAVAVKDAEITKLKALVASGQMSGATLAPAIEAAERARSQLLAKSEQQTERDAAKVERLLPNAAERYREAVGQLREAHKGLTPADFIDARGLVHDLLRGPATVRKRKKDGRTVLAITPDPMALLRATGSNADNVVAGAGFEPATFGL